MRLSRKKQSSSNQYANPQQILQLIKIKEQINQRTLAVVPAALIYILVVQLLNYSLDHPTRGAPFKENLAFANFVLQIGTQIFPYALYPNIYQKKLTYQQAESFIQRAESLDKFSASMSTAVIIEIVLYYVVCGGPATLVGLSMALLAVIGLLSYQPYKKNRQQKLIQHHQNLQAALEEIFQSVYIIQKHVGINNYVSIECTHHYLKISFADKEYQKKCHQVSAQFPGLFVMNVLASLLVKSLSYCQILVFPRPRASS